MKKILFIGFCLLAQLAVAQKEAPKWVDKAKKAVFSVVTYDKEDKLLNTGNGFFVSEDGIALSDYSLFKGAQRAVVINFEGKQMPVKSILGVNEMYDVVKFKVEIPKKVPALEVTTVAPVKDSEIYLLPYSTKKDRSCSVGKVMEISPLQGGHHYYTLQLSFTDKKVSCPVVDADGQVFGLAQKDAAGDTTRCYAVGASFAMSLAVNGLSFADASLKNIGIPKALPDTEEQALVMLYMTAPTLSADDYLALLNRFIEQFPNSTAGYVRRASHYAFSYKDDKYLTLAEEDLNKAMKLADKKDDIFYNESKIIYSYQLSKPEHQYKDWTYAKALEEIDKALTLNSLPIYTQHKGNIYFAMQDYEKAYACYDQVNKTNIASAETFYSAAKTKQLMKGDINEILALLDSAVAKFTAPMPAEAAPYIFERAQVREQKGLYKESVADYDTYYQTVNGKVNDLFYYYREQVNYKAKNFKRALEDIQKAIELSPKDATYLAELGAVNIRVARYEEAIKNVQDALAIDPKFAACYRLMGFCQIQLGKKTEACQNFAKAKELGDTAVDSLIEKYCK